MQKTTHTNRERASCFERNVKIIYMLNQIKLDILSVLMKISALQMFQQPKSPKKFGSHSTINHFVIGNMLRVEKNCRYFSLERCIERKKTEKNRCFDSGVSRFNFSLSKYVCCAKISVRVKRLRRNKNVHIVNFLLIFLTAILILTTYLIGTFFAYTFSRKSRIYDNIYLFYFILFVLCSKNGHFLQFYIHTHFLHIILA